MELAKAKVAGHHVVKNSGWLPVEKKLSILAGPDGFGKSTILKALLALNPLSSQQQLSTFGEYPDHFFTKGYRRKVDPAKKTAAFGVFQCGKNLLDQLVNLDPVLYETDMIEVGRRLDFSRWITFVEIATSTRWSEIAADSFTLQNFVATQTESQKIVDQFELFSHIKNTDRIKGELAENIGAWLDTIEKFIDATHRTLFDRVRFGVYRFSRFIKARQAVSDHLPHFLYFSNSHLLKSKIDLSKPSKIDPHLKRFFELESKSNPNLKNYASLVNRYLNEYWSDATSQISFAIEGNILKISVHSSNNNKIPVDKCGPVFHWQVSFIIALLANTDNSLDNVILLLDEPDGTMGKKDRKRIRKAVDQITQFFQVIVTTKSSMFIQEEDILKCVQLLIKEDEETGTIVEPAESLEQVTDLLESG